MKLKLLIYLLLINSCILSAQSTRLLSNMDTTYVPENYYLANFTLESYYASGSGDVEIKYGELESDLLNAAVFFALNKERLKKRRKVLTYEPYLDYLGYNCAHYYSRSKFKPSKRNELLYEKNLYLAARSKPIPCHLFSTQTRLVSIMNVEPKREIHRKRGDSRSAYGLYYRLPPELRNEPAEIVEVFTYNEFAEQVVKEMYSGRKRNRLNSKSYEIMAVYVYIEPKSLNRNKSPYAKVIQIMGAKRLAVES